MEVGFPTGVDVVGTFWDFDERGNSLEVNDLTIIIVTVFNTVVIISINLEFGFP